jgi:heptosyltransferase-2
MSTPRGAESPGRVVVRAPNWLGDAVMALPAMAAVRAHFPSAHLTVAATPAVAAILREDTDVNPDAILELPHAVRGVVPLLAAGRFDLGVLFPNSFRSAWQLWRAGVPGRWGYSTRGRSLLLTRRGRLDRSGGRHHADYYRAVVRGLDLACGDEAPRIGVSTASRERARALLQRARVADGARLVGLAPGAAYGQAKRWPPPRVAGLIANLVRAHEVTCVVVGASHDRATAREIESWLRAHAPDALPRMVNLVGQTSLGELAGVTARCDVFVSNDSGAMHVSAALGRPVVAIFGSTDERATRPIGDHDVITQPVFCRPCHLRDCPIDHRCMTRITVDMVFAATVRHLAAR